MPFAEKYRFTMGLPAAGAVIGGFGVESCDVAHEGRGDGVYEYPVSMVVCGPGGQQAAKRAVREALDHGHTTFSGYGNPYQLRLGRIEVASLGEGRYRVTARGTGVRFDLERELRRFVAYAAAHGRAADEALIGPYVEAYKRDITRRKPELAC